MFSNRTIPKKVLLYIISRLQLAILCCCVNSYFNITLIFLNKKPLEKIGLKVS